MCTRIIDRELLLFCLITHATLKPFHSLTRSSKKMWKFSHAEWSQKEKYFLWKNVENSSIFFYHRENLYFKNSSLLNQIPQKRVEINWKNKKPCLALSLVSIWTYFYGGSSNILLPLHSWNWCKKLHKIVFKNFLH